MAKLTRRALYSRAERAVQRQARREWRQSSLGRVIEQVRADYRAGTRFTGKLDMILQNFQRGGINGALRSASGTSLNGLVQDIVRYSRGPQAGLVDAFLRQLGPAGSIISAIASAVSNHRRRPTSGDKDIDAARAFLEAFGYTVTAPHIPRTSDTGKSIDAAREFLEREGFEVRPSGKTAPESSRGTATEEGGPPSPAGGGGRGGGDSGSADAGGRDTGTGEGERPREHGNTVEVEAGGFRGRFAKDHPIVTKRKVLTPESSNVYWFLYDIDTQTLYIKFDNPKTKSNPGKRPGPLYSYSHVPPQLFLDMLQAPSKGGFVWDRIRIRGTVSGHRYSYDLVSVREGYVPRKATMTPTGEWYIQRKVNTINKRGVRKSLVSRPSAPAWSPNRGRPSRAQPNRGR